MSSLLSHCVRIDCANCGVPDKRAQFTENISRHLDIRGTRWSKDTYKLDWVLSLPGADQGMTGLELTQRAATYGRPKTQAGDSRR
jgi:hypothetical protein